MGALLPAHLPHAGMVQLGALLVLSWLVAWAGVISLGWWEGTVGSVIGNPLPPTVSSMSPNSSHQLTFQAGKVWEMPSFMSL